MQRRRYSHAYQRRRYPHTPLWLSLPVFLSARSEAPASASVVRDRAHDPVVRARHAHCHGAIRGTGMQMHACACDVFCVAGAGRDAGLARFAIGTRAELDAGRTPRWRGGRYACALALAAGGRRVRPLVTAGCQQCALCALSLHWRSAADARNRTRARVRWWSVGCSVCAVCSESPRPSLRRTASQPSQTTARRASLTALGRATDTRAPRWPASALC